MFGCSVELDLSEFFNDIRKHSCIYIDFKECKVIRDAENHIKNVFSISEDICLVKTKCLSNDVCLFPSSENVRLLQAIYTTVKVKVLPVNSERGTENIDVLRPIKTENYAYKIENNDLFVENEDENLNVECDDETDQYQCEYDAVSLQIVESGLNQYKDNGITKVLCDISVQTEDLVSSESVSLIDLNDNFFGDDEQTENKQCENKNTQDDVVFVSKSNKNEDGNIIVFHNKNRFMYNVPSVIDLETSHASDSDCKIVDTNKNLTSYVLKPNVRKNKSLIKIVEPNQCSLVEDATYNGPKTYDNPPYVDCTNQKIKKPKKRQKNQFQISKSNDNTCNEIEMKETNSSHVTNFKDESFAVHRTITKNNFTKKSKCTNLEYESKNEIKYELYGSDVNQDNMSNDHRRNKDQFLQEESTINSNKSIVLSKHRKELKEINSSMRGIEGYDCKVNTHKRSNNFQRKKKLSDNFKLVNGIQNRENNNIIQTETTDCPGPSNTKNENYTNEKSEQLKHEHLFKEDNPELLIALKNEMYEQINQKLIELNKYESEMPEQCKEIGQINYSNNSSIKKHIDNDSSYTESDKSSLVTVSSIQNSTNDFNEYPLMRKRKRKRRHNKKIKREKLAAAAEKLLATVDFPKPSYVYQPKTNFQCKNKHKFFSDDDFNEDMNSPETPSEHCISKENSDVPKVSNTDDIAESDPKDTIQNDELEHFEVIENVSDNVGISKLNTAPNQLQNIKQISTVWGKKPSSTAEEICNQDLRSLLNKAKTDKKVLVFEYKKHSNRNLTSVKKTPVLVEPDISTNVSTVYKSPISEELKFFQKSEISNENIQSQKIIDSKISGNRNIDEDLRTGVIALDCKEMTKDVDDSSKIIDVTNYPIINHAIEGDIIIFKMLRLGIDYQPEISKQIIAKILSIKSNAPSSKIVGLHVLRGVEEFKSPEGKFSLEETEKIESKQLLELQWSDMIEPRLFYP